MPPVEGVNVTFEKAPRGKTSKRKQQKLGLELGRPGAPGFHPASRPAHRRTLLARPHTGLTRRAADIR
jgi:hypothetical protein